jgi:hypothetical protein
MRSKIRVAASAGVAGYYGISHGVSRRSEVDKLLVDDTYIFPVNIVVFVSIASTFFTNL